MNAGPSPERRESAGDRGGRSGSVARVLRRELEPLIQLVDGVRQRVDDGWADVVLEVRPGLVEAVRGVVEAVRRGLHFGGDRLHLARRVGEGFGETLRALAQHGGEVADAGHVGHALLDLRILDAREVVERVLQRVDRTVRRDLGATSAFCRMRYV